MIVEMILYSVPFIIYNLGLPLPPLKLKKNHYGNGILTNVSSFGIIDTYAPLVDF